MRAAGFSLVEVLIATAITVTITGLACALAVEAQATWRADSARVDLQQRVRVATEAVLRALVDAGAGPHHGDSRGPLGRALPPILPRRVGIRAADAPGVFRTDRFSVLRSIPEAEQATLGFPTAPGGTTIDLAPSCALPSCGFGRGDKVLLYDLHGNYDVFTVDSAHDLTLTVRHHGPGAFAGYARGSPVVAVESFSLSFDRQAHTLRTYDGDASDLPLLDDVVGMRVEYYGDGAPPVWPRAEDGEANCLYDADGTYTGPATPPEGARSTVALTPEGLTDGPWCGTGGNQFDADLLRVRRVRVVLRLQASDRAVRGIDAHRFLLPGGARSSAAEVPDVVAIVDVAPRNMGHGWLSVTRVVDPITGGPAAEDVDR